MKILILEGGQYLTDSPDKPEPGKRYFLEDATKGSGKQRRAWEALTHEYWKSGLHPKYGGDPLSTFRDKIKLSLGEGFELYIYADIIDGKAVIREAKQYEDVPLRIRQDEQLRDIIRGRLKSTTKYTLKQWQRMIDGTIDDMVAAGVNSKKFQEILDGMAENDKQRKA